MVLLPASDLCLTVQEIPSDSEVIRIFDSNRTLIALAICSPMAVKKDRYVFTSVLLKEEYNSAVSKLLDAYLRAEKRGALSDFEAISLSEAPNNITPVRSLVKQIKVRLVWGVLIVISLLLNISILSLLRLWNGT